MSAPYPVGYRKPPIKNQFKKGQSGNPSGQPKRRLPKLPLDFQTNLIAELKSSITITEGGKKKKISKLEAFLKSIIAQALKGDKTTTKLVMNFIEKQPKYAFAVDDDDEVVGVVTKANLKAMHEFLEKADEYAQVLELSDQEKGNNGQSS
jgi:hypothetical protein